MFGKMYLFLSKKKKKKEEKYVFGHPVNWNLFNLYLSYRKDSDISWNFHLMENPPPPNVCNKLKMSKYMLLPACSCVVWYIMTN